MSLLNKKKDMTAFDMRKKPCRQNAFLLPFIFGASFFATRKFHLKINKINMQGLKPPYLVLSTHQGFSDYYIAPLALFPHRANYVSDMEGFAAFGKALYRGIGCIGKRRYVPDIAVVKNILHVVKKNKDIIVLFPESRHSNVGTTSLLPDNMGKLCKLLGLPVVTLSVHGSYLANPFWDEAHTRKVHQEATLECIYSADDVKSACESDIQKRIEEKLTYNEYIWQKDNKISIKGENLAKGLENPLYKCKNCGKEFFMKSSGNTLKCEACGAEWVLSEYGELCGEGGKLSIPDWYEWERQSAIDELKEGFTEAKFNVRVEALPNEKGFVPLGDGILKSNAAGFTLKLSDENLTFSSKSMESLQTEYNYRGKGPCIVLSTKDCCYYIYSSDKSFCPTKLQFKAEYLHKISKLSLIKATTEEP